MKYDKKYYCDNWPNYVEKKVKKELSLLLIKEKYTK